MSDVLELRAKRARMAAELAEVTDRAEDALEGGLANGVGLAERAERLKKGLARLDEEIAESREAEIEMIKRFAANPANREGLDRDPLANPRDVTRPRFGNPWGNPQAAMTASEVQSRAISAIDLASGMSDLSLQTATQKLEQAESFGDRGVADLVLASTSPDYTAAFSRWLRDEFDPCSQNELAAVRHVRALQRAMGVGTDSAGGFLVPESLDPNLILGDAGPPTRSVNWRKRLSRRLGLTRS